MMAPSIILVRPQMGENIGAAARAMANFGLGDLCLVAPRDGWPNVKAADTAGRAMNLIDDAVVFADVKDAVADRQFVLATTARSRAMSLPVMDVREAMQELHRRSARGEHCAVMFGPERTGLENEDIALADAVVTIPVAPDYTSLNIGQAVVVCAYEWWMALASDDATCAVAPPSEGGRLGGGLNQAPLSIQPPPFPSPSGGGPLALTRSPASPLAPRSHLTGLLDQLELALDDVNFWRVPEKKEIMWRNIRTTLVRAGLSEQEIATWRGMVKALRGDR